MEMRLLGACPFPQARNRLGCAGVLARLYLVPRARLDRTCAARLSGYKAICIRAQEGLNASSVRKIADADRPRPVLRLSSESAAVDAAFNSNEGNLGHSQPRHTAATAMVLRLWHAETALGGPGVTIAETGARRDRTRGRERRAARSIKDLGSCPPSPFASYCPTRA
jgi:hypothetical protein